MPTPPPLARLHNEIDARVAAIRDGHPDWPCGKGCGGCCRTLAAIPQLTAAEWDLLRAGLAALAPRQIARITHDLATLTNRQLGPVVCPLLDQTAGICLVYAQRPVACRTYGFYVQRDLGVYCRDLEARVAGGALADVVWGNHDAIDRQLAGLGTSRALTEWFERSQQG